MMKRPVLGRDFFLTGAVTAFRVLKIGVFPWFRSRGNGAAREYGEGDRRPLPAHLQRRGAAIFSSSFYAPSS